MIILYILFIFRYILIYSIECYNSCLNCTDLGDENNHKCNECLNNYYFLENTNNCYSLNNISKNYFLFQNKLYKCNSRCENCSNFPEKYSDNCIYCSDNYIKIQLYCIKYLNKYTVNYLDKNLEYIYNESSPLVHSKYYSVVVYNYLETEQVNKYYNIGNISRFYIENCIERIKFIFNKTDEELFIIKIDIIENDYHLNSIIFDVFDNYFSTFNLGICNNESIIVQRPIINYSMINYSLAKNFSKYSINIYDENDEFFNNICFPFNYEKRSDVILKDRRKNFFLNISLCEDGCIFKGINFNNDTINCECNIFGLRNKNLIDLYDVEFLNFDMITKNFKNELYDSNFFIIKCYKLVFNLKYLKNNYGFFFQLILFVLNLIIFLIYLKRDNISKIINHLSNIYKRKYHSFYFSNNNNFNNCSLSNVSNFIFLNDKNKQIISSSNNNNKSIDNYNIYLELSNNKTKKTNDNSKQYLSSNINLKQNVNTNNIYKSDIVQQLFFSKYKNKYINNNNNINIKNKNNIKKKKSIQKEKIKFIILYQKYIKQIHIIIKLFYINKLEIATIQIMNLIFIIALQNTITALFYDEKKISEIFYNEGNFSILEQIPKIIYSYLITIFINFFLLQLITSKRIFEKLLKQKYLFNIFMKKLKYIIRIFHIKIHIFFVINFIFFLFFIYYCSAFCAIYRYNQKFWLVNAFITFIFEMIYPFFLCIFFVILKIISIKIKSNCVNTLNEFMISIF